MSIKGCVFRIRIYGMCFYTKFKPFLKHKDFENIYREGHIKILERGVKPNDYSIKVLDRGGSSQMITVDYNRGRGV